MVAEQPESAEVLLNDSGSLVALQLQPPRTREREREGEGEREVDVLSSRISAVQRESLLLVLVLFRDDSYLLNVRLRLRRRHVGRPVHSVRPPRPRGREQVVWLDCPALGAQPPLHARVRERRVRRRVHVLGDVVHRAEAVHVRLSDRPVVAAVVLRTFRKMPRAKRQQRIRRRVAEDLVLAHVAALLRETLLSVRPPAAEGQPILLLLLGCCALRRLLLRDADGLPVRGNYAHHANSIRLRRCALRLAHEAIRTQRQGVRILDRDVFVVVMSEEVNACRLVECAV